MTYNNLPLVQLDIVDDDSAIGIDFVAFVDRPAIQKNFQAFNANMRQSFTITNEERRIVGGPLMLASTPIYRNDSENGEYYVSFSPEAIERGAQKFFAQGFQSNVNLMHDSGQQQQDITMFESFLVDERRGIKPMAGYEDAPQGSWFGSFKVNNDAVWNDIKGGKFKGFSVEGIFAQSKPTDKASEFLDHLDKLLQEAGY